MRIRHLFASLAAVSIAVAALSSCASNETPVAQPSQVSESVSEHQQTPFEYYRSAERKTILQSALTEVGNNWMTHLLTAETPATTRGWPAGSTPPANGYGVLASAPDRIEGQLYFQVSINFVGGEVDLDAPVGLFAQTATGHTLSFAGRGPLVESFADTRGIMVPDSPQAYSWHYGPALDEGDIRTMKLEDGNGDEPPYQEALKPDVQYMVVGGETGSPNVEEIKRLDSMFLRELRAIDVTGSN